MNDRTARTGYVVEEGWESKIEGGIIHGYQKN